jgi:flagellar hook-length control protein FliK
MDSLPALPLNVATPASGQASRGAADSKEADATSFDKLLDSELAAITPHGKTADLSRPAADDAALDSDKTKAKTDSKTDAKTGAADDTQVLQAILDATTAIPPAGVALTAAAPLTAAASQTAKPGEDAGTAPAHIAGARDVRASMSMPTGELPGEPAVVHSKDETQTAEKPATPTDLPAATAEKHAAPAQLAAAVPVAPPVLPAAPSADHIMPANGTALKKDAPVAKAAAPAPASASAPTHQTLEEAGATPSTAQSAAADGVVLPRNEPTLERIRSDSVLPSSVEKPATPDSAPTGNPIPSSLDALSSAALVSKWTAGPQGDTVNATHTPASARIDTPIGANGWGEAFSQKVVWLVDRQQQTAELHVNPPHLGPVDVVLNLKDDGARIAFCSPHPAVREAIEASLADLRNALSQHGLSLGQTLVSADPGTAREQMQGDNPRNPQRSSMTVSDSGSVSETQTIRPIRRGLVDIFA